MSTARKGVNIKLMKLFYKYADDERKEVKDECKKEEQKSECEVKGTNETSYPPFNFSWLVERKIAGMGCPQNVANVNYIADVGINHLITLSSEKIPPILECKKNLKWTEIGIKEFGAPTLKQIIKFIEICERAEMRGEVIAVHCRHGRGRTGTMLACYLVYFKHMTPERAVLTVRALRPGSCETYEQQKMVCHYHDCLRGNITKPDYRLVDDKIYFDLSMKYMFGDEKKEPEIKEEVIDNIEIKPDTHEEIKAERKISKAMAINHKIYF